MSKEEAESLCSLIEGNTVYDNINGEFLVETCLSVPEISEILQQQGARLDNNE